MTFGAMHSSLSPAGICCTPIVPSLLALAGASTPQIFGLTGRIQGFFATYELPILVFAWSGCCSHCVSPRETSWAHALFPNGADPPMVKTRKNPRIKIKKNTQAMKQSRAPRFQRSFF